MVNQYLLRAKGGVVNLNPSSDMDVVSIMPKKKKKTLLDKLGVHIEGLE